ncbi:MAG TPA: hypothetical protein ENK37_03645 [Oceanithermus profundus]|uniref:Uncharacterized protein n=1 Tax=Oceanithermus profundus TaxID=187137 RepID=A0A7C4ZG73_9DEIN|nr:hypothetical protein [Oceanithermus profundus]
MTTKGPDSEQEPRWWQVLRETYYATVVSRDELSENYVVIRVVADEPRAEFAAGQYTTLGLSVLSFAFPTRCPIANRPRPTS